MGKELDVLLQLFFAICIKRGDEKIIDRTEVSMKINESALDSILRIFSGFTLLYLGLGGVLVGLAALVADILGVIILLTGVVGFCPLYVIFKPKK